MQGIQQICFPNRATHITHNTARTACGSAHTLSRGGANFRRAATRRDVISLFTATNYAQHPPLAIHSFNMFDPL